MEETLCSSRLVLPTSLHKLTEAQITGFLGEGCISVFWGEMWTEKRVRSTLGFVVLSVAVICAKLLYPTPHLLGSFWRLYIIGFL